jgi:hypothetical protein
MKTLYLTNSSANIAVDTDNNSVSTVEPEDRYELRNIFYIDEPTHVVFNGTFKGDEVSEEVDAKKGDIVLQFYNNRFNKHILAVVKNKQWAANIKNKRDIVQKETEEWAAKNNLDVCTDCAPCDAEIKCSLN